MTSTDVKMDARKQNARLATGATFSNRETVAAVVVVFHLQILRPSRSVYIIIRSYRLTVILQNLEPTLTFYKYS